MYWSRKDEITLVERNAMMQGAIRKLLDITTEDFSRSIYRTRSTFAITHVAPPGKLQENVENSIKDSQWYVDNKYPDLALILNEYAMVYNQFAYSVPRVITDLTVIYMAVMHAPFFQQLGMNVPLCNLETGTPHQALITAAIDTALARWQDKYTEHYKWDHGLLNYHTQWDFSRTFTAQVVHLNLEARH